MSSATPSLTGNFTATGNSSTFTPNYLKDFNVSIWGTFIGTVVLERSFDDGVTWIQKWPDEVYQITSTRTFSDNEPEENVIYRFRCSAFTSGVINYRISQ